MLIILKYIHKMNSKEDIDPPQKNKETIGYI